MHTLKHIYHGLRPTYELPSNTWYAIGKTTMPSALDYHIMFPQCWKLPEDAFEHFLSTSLDGIIWDFVSGGPLLSPGKRDSWYVGGFHIGTGMVELQDKRMGVLIN